MNKLLSDIPGESKEKEQNLFFRLIEERANQSSNKKNENFILNDLKKIKNCFENKGLGAGGEDGYETLINKYKKNIEDSSKKSIEGIRKRYADYNEKKGDSEVKGGGGDFGCKKLSWCEGDGEGDEYFR